MTDKEKAEIIKNSKKSNGILSLLGFGAKAGKLIFGTDRICDEIRRHGVAGEEGRGGHGLVLVSSDASDNTFKRIRNACEYYNVRIERISLSSAQLAEKTGHGTDAAAVGVFDYNFKQGFIDILEKK